MDAMPAVNAPPHVPKELIFDFDLFNPEGFDAAGVEDIHVIWKRVQDTHPKLFWTPRYGGHWVATRFAEIEKMLLDPVTYSNKEVFIPRNVLPRMLPVNLDPPDHGPIRRLLMPAFAPKNLQSVTDKARQVAIEIIERLRPLGQCDFVRDFAGSMPIIALLTLIQMPEEDNTYLRGLAEQAAKVVGPEAAAARGEMAAYVQERIRERRETPMGDFISGLVHAQAGGRKLSDAEVFELCLVVIGGGLDTVVSTMSFAAAYLAGHEDARRALREHPEKLDNAVEEVMRRFSTSNLGRLVQQDTELGGQKLHAGDMIIGIFPLAGLDENINADPLRFDIMRERPRHLAFGIGPHVCIGNALARREIKIFLEEWLKRIPDFSIKPGTRPVVTTGVVNSAVSLQLTWPV